MAAWMGIRTVRRGEGGKLAVVLMEVAVKRIKGVVEGARRRDMAIGFMNIRLRQYR